MYGDIVTHTSANSRGEERWVGLLASTDSLYLITYWKWSMAQILLQIGQLTTRQ